MLLETWPYAWKQRYFFNVLTKTRYFNTGFAFLRYKNTNWYEPKFSKKIRREITYFPKYIFFGFFLDWAGLGPLILGWAGLVRPSEQWRRCSEEENKEKGRGTDLWWLRGAAGGCWPENGLDNGRPFFFFSVFFLLLCSLLFLFFLCFFFSPLLSPASPFFFCF